MSGGRFSLGLWQKALAQWRERKDGISTAAEWPPPVGGGKKQSSQRHSLPATQDTSEVYRRCCLKRIGWEELT